MVEKEERNKKIYEEWRQGKTYRQLMIDYELSLGAIRTILIKYWALYGRERMK